MERIQTFKPIIGDDDPYITIALRDLPTGYGFDGLVFDPAKPLTYALKERLIDVATRYYRNYEIVGETFTDFRENLQLDLDLNADTFEKMLAVYNDDIAKPTQSREIRRTYDLMDTSTGSENTDITENNSESETNTNAEASNITDSTTIKDTTTNGLTREESGTDTENGNTSSNTETTDYDIPLDNGTAQGTSKQIGISEATNNSSNTITRGTTEKSTLITDKTESSTRNATNNANGEKAVTGERSSVGRTNTTGENKKTGTEVEYWSDVGVAPNYTLLNGFLDNNRTLEQVFINFFKNDFMIMEVYYG